MHESGHTLGAVQPTAPRYDSQNPFHTRDEYDRMSYGVNTYVSSACNDTTLEKRYDCNQNDYFHTNPSPSEYLGNAWNTADNKFLVKGAQD